MNSEKTVIKASEFNKRVEIEASYLMYMDRMKKDEAFKVAKNYVGKTYAAKEKH